MQAPQQQYVSWWVGLPPQQFFVEAQKRTPEMSASRIAQQIDGTRGIVELKYSGKYRATIRMD